MGIYNRVADNTKIISWPQNKVRWLIFHYLVGVIVALYILLFEQYFIGLDWPHWLAWAFTAGLAPVTFAFLAMLIVRRKQRK